MSRYVVILLLFFCHSAFAQSGLCDPITPFYVANLSGNPGGTWFSPQDSRVGNCCGTTSPLRCIEFEVTLDSSSVGIIFDIFSGAIPSGSLFYQVNCGPQIPVGSMICLNGPGPHTITFCKPGNNPNVYSIQSIPGFIQTTSTNTVEGCAIALHVEGFNESTLTWHEISSGTGMYDSLFTCLSGCDTTLFQTTINLPPYIEVQVCGFTAPSVCDSTSVYVCDTITITIEDPLSVTIAPDTFVTCVNDPLPSLIPTITGGTGNFIYQWYDNVNGTGTLVGTDSIYNATISGNYSLVVFDSLFSSCSIDTANSYVQITPNLAISSSGGSPVCRGDSIYLSSNAGSNQLLWYVNDSLICSNCPSITIPSPSNIDTLYIIAMDTILCPDTALLTIIIAPTFSEFIFDTICSNQTYILPGGATTSTTGTYIDSLQTTNGCDSIITTNLTVHPAFNSSVFDTICSNESYLLPDGSSTNVAGVYRDTFATTLGCDSIITTNLTVHPSYNIIVNDTICSNESYTLPNGSSTTIAGIYTDTLNTITACDSVITTNLTVRPTFNMVVNDTICSNQTYTLPGGSTTSTTGTYIDSLQTTNGCDSIITTNLTVHPAFNSSVFDTICSNESYLLPNGSSANVSGVYRDTFATTLGCDSIITTNLTVHPSYNITVNDTICANESYTLPSGIITSMAGTYEDTLISLAGCDSVITTNLTVSPTFTLTVNDTICSNQTYTLPGGTTTSSAGTFIDNLFTANGCDSIITTNLTVLPTAHTENVVLCFGENYTLPSGIVVDSSGTYTSNLVSSFACDSIITTTLTILAASITSVSTTICIGDSLSIGSSVYTSTGNYTDTIINSFGCDSIVTLNLSVLPNSFLQIDTTICPGTSIEIGGTTFDEAGTFQLLDLNSFGCDSITQIELSFSAESFIDAGNDFVAEPGEIHTVNSSGFDTLFALSYGWIQDNDLLCSNCTNYQALTSSEGLIYTAFVIDTNNCTFTDEVLFLVNKSCPDNYLEVPNIISPNGDGANDEFYIKNPSFLNIEYYRIFNRWGELVFETYDETKRWNGEFRNQIANPGVFSYYIKGRCLDEKDFIKTGNITILK